MMPGMMEKLIMRVRMTMVMRIRTGIMKVALAIANKTMTMINLVSSTVH